MTTAEQNAATMRRFVQQVQSEGRIELVDDYLSPDFVDRTPFPGAGTVFGMLRAAFPDHDEVVVHMVSEGDRVTTYKTFNGTHRGEFMGVPATGRPVSFRLMHIVRFDDGRIAEHWNVVDVAGLLQAARRAAG